MSTNTLDGSTKNKEMETVLLDVIKTLEDSQKGFADIGEHLKDNPSSVTSSRRASSAPTSAPSSRTNSIAPVWPTSRNPARSPAPSTAPGATSRPSSAGGDHGLLETAEQGEDEAKKAYKKALEHELPLPIRELLVEQQEQVLASHDFIKASRDASATK